MRLVKMRRLTRRRFGRKLLAVITASCVLAMVAVGVGVWLGDQAGQVPGLPGATAASTSSAATAQALDPSEVPEGNSGQVTSSTGVDFGAGRPRLRGSYFAQTTDPEVFAASVQGAVGYDYSATQPSDAGAEAQRIVDEWLAGMAGEDGPLGIEKHQILRQAVQDSVNPDELAYRIAARQVDEVDVLGVVPTDNSTLRANAGDEVYLDVVGNRDTIFALTTTARVRTTTQAVGDVSGFTQSRVTVMNLLINCDPQVNDGVCELIGVIGGGGQ